MTLLFLTIIVIAGGIALAMVVREDPGYVLIGYDTYTVETTLAISVAVALAAVFVLYFAIRMLSYVLFAPKKIGKWQNQRRDRAANIALTNGLLAQAEGKWKQSEKTLLSYARKTKSAANYLAAAKSAQAQGATQRMNHYLDLAQANEPDASCAIRLTQAELLIDGGQYDRAEAALTRILKEEPRNNRALLLLNKVYQETGKWEKLSEILYALKRNKVLSIEAYNALEKKVYFNVLQGLAKGGSLIALRNTWSIVPKYLQRDSDIIAVYTEKLINSDQHEEAEPILCDAIKKRWDDRLVYLYGLIYTDDPYNQLSTAEKWIQVKPTNPALLLTLGRLSSRSQLWGKSRSYLEASIENGGGAESYHALAQVLEHIDEPELAASLYRKGLEMSSDKGLPELAALTAQKKALQVEETQDEIKEIAEQITLEKPQKTAIEEVKPAEKIEPVKTNTQQKVAASAA